MRHKDPELMKKIAGFVEEFYGIRNRMPSTAEIANELHVAINANLKVSHFGSKR